MRQRQGGAHGASVPEERQHDTARPPELHRRVVRNWARSIRQTGYVDSGLAVLTPAFILSIV